jgi:hypothetical protein
MSARGDAHAGHADEGTVADDGDACARGDDVRLLAWGDGWSAEDGKWVVSEAGDERGVRLVALERLALLLFDRRQPEPQP